jgi:hypothetical protein
MRNNFLIAVLFFAIGILPFTTSAQHLTISSVGDVGPTSGANWSIINNVLNIGNSGNASINISVIVNHLQNTGNLTINLPWQSGVRRNININNTITYSGSSTRTLTFQSANDIVFANAAGITSATASLNVVLRSTTGLSSGDPDSGLIKMDGINIDTKGGHFWVGGGTSSTTWNGLTVGNSPAVTWMDDVPGISVVGSTIASGGGNIHMSALSWNSSDDDGVNYAINVQNSNISSGAGAIDFLGDLNGRYTNGIGLYVRGTTSITSTTGPIFLRGYGTDQSTNGNSWRVGAFIQGSAQIKSVSGNITVVGDANFTATFNDKEGLNITDGAAICSQTGNITLRGTNNLESSGQFSNSIRFAAANAANSIRIGFDGTNAYSGNISIEGNSIYQRSTHLGAGSIAVQTTGTLTIQPTGNTFTYMRAANSDALTFDDDWNFGTNLGGFVYGKMTNTTNLTYGNSLRTNGPVTFYTGNTQLGVGVEIRTDGANGNINFLSSNGVGTIANSGATRGKIMTTNGGSIHINADYDNNNAGDLNIDWLTIDGGTGNVLLETATFNWNTGSQVALPEFYSNGGALTIRNTSSSNNGISTNWFAMFGTFGGVTLGREGGIGTISLTSCTSCASSALNFGTTAFQIAGPITALGGIINANFNLRSTASGSDILLKADKHIVVRENVAVQSNNGDITFWSNSNGVADATDGDFIGIYSGVSINSANGLTNQTSGGGTITMAGGNTSQVLPSGTVVPTAYAYSSRTTNWVDPVLPPGGVNFGEKRSAVGGLNTVNIYSGGGDIVIKGKSSSSSAGIQWLSGPTGATQVINSGSGTVTIDGLSTSSTAHGIEFMSYASVVYPTIISSNTSSTAIRIIGETFSTNNRAGYQGSLKLEANGTGGGIEVNGKVASSSNYGAIEAGSLFAYAASGPITFISEGGLGLKAGGLWGKGTLASSSSNITLKSDRISLYTATIETTGTLTVEPLGASFASALTFPITNLTVVNTVSGLTLGKPSNEANITFGNTTSINGPITAYGGTITANANLTSTASTGTGISLNGQKIIQNSGIAVTTSGANIDYLASGLTTTSGADDAIKIGNVSGARASINAGAGNVSLTGSFGTTSTAGAPNDFGIWLFSTDVITSGIGSITLTGDATNTLSTTASVYGINMGNATLKTASGAITLNGTGGKASGNSRGIVVDQYSNKIISASGAITLNEIKPTGFTGTYTGFFMQPISTVHSFIGADGTEVPTSSSSVTINGDRASFVTNGTFRNNINTSGAIVLESVANSFEAAPLLTGLTISGNPSSVRIGKTTNTANITIESVITAAGPIDVYGGNIAINENLTSTASGAAVLLKATTNINQAASKTITTNAGAVNLWADSDDNSVGYVQLLANSAINSTGGDINLGGGANLTSDYAFGTTAETCPEVVGTQYISGVHLRQSTSLNSNGGNISVRGQNANTAASAMSFGVSLRGVTMNSGTGKIALNGIATGSGSVNAQGVASWGTLTLRSANTSSDAISITGNALSSVGSSSLGINAVALFESTGAGGGITINGKSGVASTNASVNIGGDILAASGPITISGENSSGVVHNIIFGSTTTIGKKSGTNVTSSSSNVILEGNSINTPGAVLVDCSGTLTVRPFGNSFASALSWPMPNISLASSITGLTIGKTTNTANLTFTNATTINGPITIYGGTLALNENISSLAGSTISLYGNILNVASGKTVTSSGLLIVAPQNSAGSIGMGGAAGTLQLPASYFSTNFTDGFSLIQIGTNDHSSAIASNAFNLRDNMALYTTGTVTLGGKPVLGVNNLTLGSTISSISSGATNYFQTNGTGKVFRNIPNGSNLILPIGRAFYNPVTIKNNTGAADDFSALVLDLVFLYGTNGPLIVTPHVKATWDISKTNANAGSGIDFEFGWDLSQEDGTFTSYKLNHHATTWSFAEGTSQTPSGTSTKSMSHTDYTGTFSPFAISEGTSALPVELISFNANCSSNDVKITWETASEYNSSHFIIEGSENGFSWKKLVDLPSSGNSNSLITYEFTVPSDIARAINYYRLMQVDVDGNSTQYGAISKSCNPTSSFDAVIAPNPNNGKFALNIFSDRSQEILIQLTNSDGKIISSEQLENSAGSSSHYMNLEGIATGIYTLQVYHLNGVLNKKIVIQ